MKTVYSAKAGEQLIETYTSKFNGECHIIDEGCLLLGLVILKAPNKKTVVIKEQYINEWNSGYSIKMYNKCPKKYENL